MTSPTKTNLMELLALHPPRTNFNIIRIDESYCVRVAKIQGRFPWHFHQNGDEGWFVFAGRVRIDTENGSVELAVGDFTVIPQGIRHSPEALESETMVVIFNRRNLGLVLDDPQADLGGFQMYDEP